VAYRRPALCRECGRSFRPAREHFHTCPECWVPSDRTPRRRETGDDQVVLDVETVRAARTLCHPDLHSSAFREVATRVSARLNALLDAHRRRRAA